MLFLLKALWKAKWPLSPPGTQCHTSLSVTQYHMSVSLSHHSMSVSHRHCHSVSHITASHITKCQCYTYHFTQCHSVRNIQYHNVVHFTQCHTMSHMSFNVTYHMSLTVMCQCHTCHSVSHVTVISVLQNVTHIKVTKCHSVTQVTQCQSHVANT